MSAVLEQIDVSKAGVNIVPSEKEAKKPRFLPPRSNSLVAIERTKAPRRAPSRVQFGMLRSRALKMTVAIPLELERKGNTVIAKWEAIEEFGYGPNISEAVDDFGRTVEELFFTLKEKEPSLSDDLRKVWDVVRMHIQDARR